MRRRLWCVRAGLQTDLRCVPNFGQWVCKAIGQCCLDFADVAFCKALVPEFEQCDQEDASCWWNIRVGYALRDGIYSWRANSEECDCEALGGVPRRQRLQFVRDHRYRRGGVCSQVLEHILRRHLPQNCTFRNFARCWDSHLNSKWDESRVVVYPLHQPRMRVRSHGEDCVHGYASTDLRNVFSKVVGGCVNKPLRELAALVSGLLARRGERCPHRTNRGYRHNDYCQKFPPPCHKFTLRTRCK